MEEAFEVLVYQLPGLSLEDLLKHISRITHIIIFHSPNELKQCLDPMTRISCLDGYYYISDKRKQEYKENPVVHLKVIAAIMLQPFWDRTKPGLNPSSIQDAVLRSKYGSVILPSFSKFSTFLQDNLSDVVYIDVPRLGTDTKACYLSPLHGLSMILWDKFPLSTNSTSPKSEQAPSSPVPIPVPVHAPQIPVASSPPVSTGPSILGQYKIHEFRGPKVITLPIDLTTREIILIDMDNVSGWVPHILTYTIRSNQGDHKVVPVGFCGRSYEIKLNEMEKSVIQIVRVKTTAKEAVDHAISFYAAKIFLDHTFNREKNSLYQPLLFTVVSKDHALDTTELLLQSEGAQSRIIASSDELNDYCPIK